MRVLPLALALVSGCGAPVRVVVAHDAGDPVSSWSELTPDEVEALDEAAALTGLQWDLTTKAYGAVYVDFVAKDRLDPDGNGTVSAGRHYPPSFCRRLIRVDRHGELLAHEIGHALGELDHVEDPENLMFWDLPGLDLSDAQLDDIRAGADAFNACR